MVHFKQCTLRFLTVALIASGAWVPAESATLGLMPSASSTPARSDARCAWDDEDDTRQYKVVINHEEQYSIWPADRENAAGWNDAGKTGTKQECLEYIEEVWTDMRPLSLRKKMEEDERAARGE